MSITSESDDIMMLKNDEDSTTLDDANSGRDNGEIALKKGPWKSEEDAILVEYVTKHGEGNWNAVQKHSGLARCGKSCRLRWANHLRPDLKKGAFTPEEETRIIELHVKMGNKWARMAAELPGRTDNEIKNYWNTRIKRRQRANLPLYPADLCKQASSENRTDDMNSFSSGDMHNPDFMPIEIPDFNIKNMELNQRLYPPPSLGISVNNLLDISDISASSIHSKNLHPSYPNIYIPSRKKRFRGSDSSFPASNAEPLIFSAAYNNDSTTAQASSSTALLSGSHATLNGNPSSSSERPWALKELELPSLQNQAGHWCNSPSSPLPPIESTDAIDQTPHTENIHSRNLSAQNSGLLDAVLYGSQSLRNPDCNTSPMIPRASDVVVDYSSQDPYEREWYDESFYDSPLCHSTSVFSDSTPARGNSTDEPHPVQHTIGHKVHDDSSLASIHHHNYAHRPDFLLA